MKLKNLNGRLVEWLKDGPDCDVIVSSRARLARNVAGQRFVQQASKKQKAQMEEMLRHDLQAEGMEPALTYVSLHNLDPLLVELLLERRLISHQHAEADWVRGVAFDADEQLSVMVNEEDHLRIQSIRAGLRLRAAYERADAFDSLLAERVPFAYSARYGYLTACPTNTGTGLRAGVMLHIPALTMSRQINRVMDRVHEQNLAVRGLYGEGTHGAGDFYQVSNRVTLGLGEEEIVESVIHAATELAEMEREAREELRTNHADELGPRVHRALDLLRSARALSSQEALSFLSQVRMGMEMDVLDRDHLEELNHLFLLTLPAHLQTMEGRELDSSVRDERRAVYVRNKLANS